MDEPVPCPRLDKSAPGVLKEVGEVGGTGLVLHMPVFRKNDYLPIQAKLYFPYQNLSDLQPALKEILGPWECGPPERNAPFVRRTSEDSIDDFPRSAPMPDARAEGDRGHWFAGAKQAGYGGVIVHRQEAQEGLVADREAEPGGQQAGILWTDAEDCEDASVAEDPLRYVTGSTVGLRDGLGGDYDLSLRRDPSCTNFAAGSFGGG
ncbi:hypothetical protein [Roseisalinus antarcticus]|uniref:hypothetical protein n=1 Tax=Roseisalinus antarcticus TaxID=254357 RepID=UPI00190E60DB|nr:hypothetical protein [Roseisalinus antarcticus]